MSENQEIDYEKLATAFSKSLEELFSLPEGDARKRFIDISRVPLICQSILGINSQLKDLQSNLTWLVRTVLGAVILGILALLFKS